VIVECNVCEAKVDGRVIADHKSTDQDLQAEFYVALLECPQCETTLLGGGYVDWDDSPSRLWPSPEKYFSHDIPEIIRNSLEEARVCFKAGAYSACAVMAGRALEGVCRHFGTRGSRLGPGIRELHEKGVIDTRLATWAQELQRARNLSAHASGERVSKEDARDLLEFVEAIGHYVFVLTKKFKTYMARRATATGDQSLLTSVRVSDLDGRVDGQPPNGAAVDEESL